MVLKREKRNKIKLIRETDRKRQIKREREREREKRKQDLLGQVSRLRKREGQKYVNFYGKS